MDKWFPVGLRSVDVQESYSEVVDIHPFSQRPMMSPDQNICRELCGDKPKTVVTTVCSHKQGKKLRQPGRLRGECLHDEDTKTDGM